MALAPFRLYEGVSPFVRFKKMLADDLTDGLTEKELDEIRAKAAEESVRIEKARRSVSLPSRLLASGSRSL